MEACAEMGCVHVWGWMLSFLGLLHCGVLSWASCSSTKNDLGGRFGYFFFLFRGGGEGGGVRGGGRGVPFLFIKIEGGGGVSEEEEAREGEGRRGNVCGEGGGAKYFFSGPKCAASDSMTNQAKQTKKTCCLFHTCNAPIQSQKGGTHF